MSFARAPPPRAAMRRGAAIAAFRSNALRAGEVAANGPGEGPVPPPTGEAEVGTEVKTEVKAEVKAGIKEEVRKIIRTE